MNFTEAPPQIHRCEPKFVLALKLTRVFPEFQRRVERPEGVRPPRSGQSDVQLEPLTGCTGAAGAQWDSALNQTGDGPIGVMHGASR